MIIISIVPSAFVSRARPHTHTECTDSGAIAEEEIVAGCAGVAASNGRPDESRRGVCSGLGATRRGSTADRDLGTIEGESIVVLSQSTSQGTATQEDLVLCWACTVCAPLVCLLTSFDK